eukprot:Anaeramoba_ignava/c20309_g2_i1.p2 GENE.c20309_g2_i1~~c20309_g2_i1.p2  ORF type:complete len:225 (-),score=55.25 c20309_g2_i1:98-772(-)
MKKRLRDYICKNILTANDILFETDSFGNIFSLNLPNRPLLCAHIDTVQQMKDVIYIDTVKRTGNIISGQGIIGADDKCGVFVILDLLLNHKMNFNWLLTCGEEKHLLGAKAFIESSHAYKLFELPYALILDGGGSRRVIRCYESGFGPYSLDLFLSNIGSSFGYSSYFSTGSNDARVLSTFINSATISVAACNIHREEEFVDIFGLIDAHKFVKKCLESEFSDN